jgi:xylulokinase
MTEPGREAAVLGIDLGTTEVKVGLVSLDGRLLGLARAAYRTDVDPATGRAEQDPDAWWGALTTAVRILTANGRAEVLAIAADGHGPSLVAVDDLGRPTRPSIIWQDTRASREQSDLAATTGLDGWALAGLPAALWLERNEPAVAAASRWYLATWDFLALRMTGVAATSLVTGQPFPDATTLAENGIPPGRIPPAVIGGTRVGGLTEDAATQLGLRPGTPVIAGVVDAWASFHGAGMAEAGDAIDVGGAGGGFGVYWHERIAVPGSYVTIAPLPGLFSIGGAMAATGKAIDWFREAIVHDGAPIETLLDEAAATPPGADGAVFRPRAVRGSA